MYRQRLQHRSRRQLPKCTPKSQSYLRYIPIVHTVLLYCVLLLSDSDPLVFILHWLSATIRLLQSLAWKVRLCKWHESPTNDDVTKRHQNVCDYPRGRPLESCFTVFNWVFCTKKSVQIYWGGGGGGGGWKHFWGNWFFDITHGHVELAVVTVIRWLFLGVYNLS